jgi:spermidine/putrescine transport system ATP-binding protein
MNNGKFEQIGSPHDVYHEPKTAFVAGFVGDANKIRSKVLAVNGTLLTLVSDGGAEMKVEARANTLRVGDRAQVFLRPEAIELCNTQDGVNVSQAQVTSVLFNGANSSITVKDDSGDLLKIASPQTGSFANLRIGDRVLARWSPQHARCYRAEET